MPHMALMSWGLGAVPQGQELQLPPGQLPPHLLPPLGSVPLSSLKSSA